MPLTARADTIGDRIASLRTRGDVDQEALAAAARAWDDAMAAPPWDGPPRWIHGDLHPGNLVARAGTLAGIIDFGDVTAGDPAYDLAIAWLAFDGTGRETFTGELGSTVGSATWLRARGWAAAMAATLIESSGDNPDYLALGKECLAELGPRANG